MDENTFASNHGYETYAEMLENTTTVIFDCGQTWNATIIHLGWLSWTTDPFNVIGYHSTYKQANEHILFLHGIVHAEDDKKLLC